jgi:hypothetical protein
VEDGRATEGDYDIRGTVVESASGTRGPLLRLSGTPQFLAPPLLGDPEFVLSLQADTLFLLTTIDDFTDYVFIRDSAEGG